MDFDRNRLDREFREMIVPLCEAVAPTGFEEEAEAVVRRYLPEGFALSTDRLHNLIAHKPGKGPKVAVVAHLDEIGLIVRTIDSHGFLWFETLAGVQPQQLFGKHVIVKTENGHIDGVVNHMKPGRPAPCVQMPTGLDEFFIDIGAASREEVLEMGVEVGAPVALKYPTLFMGKDKQVVAGKARLHIREMLLPSGSLYENSALCLRHPAHSLQPGLHRYQTFQQFPRHRYSHLRR